MFFILIMTALCTATLWSCQPATPSEKSGSTDISVTNNDFGDSTAGDTNTKPVDTPIEATPQPTKHATAAEPSYGGKETIYISTYGANGKVWGHVTMNGKTGRGTIHDDEENSYSITVTRHGGELFGTDQNGRQYVFRM